MIPKKSNQNLKFTILVSQKTGYSAHRSLVNPYFITYIICFFVSIFVGKEVLLLPTGVAIIINVILRLHFTKTFQVISLQNNLISCNNFAKQKITSNGCFLECLTACFCCPCSIAQSKAKFELFIIIISYSCTYLSGETFIWLQESIWWRFRSWSAGSIQFDDSLIRKLHYLILWLYFKRFIFLSKKKNLFKWILSNYLSHP